MTHLAQLNKLPQHVVGRTDTKVVLRNYKGKAVLDFRGIPVEQVEQLVEVLASQLSAAHAAKA